MNNAKIYAKKIFGNGNIKKIEPFNTKFVKKYKIVVFAPASRAEKIAKAMASAGAGIIGKYSECSFTTEGKGTFRGGKGTSPYTGKTGKLEAVDEIRLEMICDAENLNNAIAGMHGSHPYEEPAYDIYEVINGIKQSIPYAVRLELKNAINIESVFRKINKNLDTELIPESWKRIKIKNAVVDFSGENTLLNIIENKSRKTLYIAKNFKKTINIRLL